MLNSHYRPLCDVKFPPYQGRQKYVHTFEIANPIMAKGFEDYIEMVASLCRAARLTHGTAHMTVDEKIVEAGTSQRRPKPHVDGCFYPSMNSWGHDGGGGGGWNHNCNSITGSALRRMPVIVASNVKGCGVWDGVFDAIPKSDGDLSHIQLGDGEILGPNAGYLLSADCIHESMLMPIRTRRMFLRIALPNDFFPGF